MMLDIAAQLHTGIIKLGLDLPQEIEQQLLDYLALLQKWNKAYNLTAIRQPSEMVVKHLLDSLSILSFIAQGKRVIDVGTGAGLPGMVIAIAQPECSVTLLDSNGKKIRFLRQVAAELKLENVEMLHSRVEDCTAQFDIVTSRAFASLADMVQGSGQLLAGDGEFFAMKGLVPHAEISALPAGVIVKEIVPLKIPFLNEERHLVRLSKIEKR
jgi:16S rRNA (guanine527-N7)-methyltransferase